MLLRNWQIWHSFLTHLDAERLDLPLVARALVELSVAESAFINDGTTFWRSQDGRVGTGVTRVEAGLTGSVARFSLPGEATPYARECLYQAAWFHYSEQRIFGEDSPAAMPYVRAFLGECHLRRGDHTITLYPILRIDAFGILSVSFRIFGPAEPVTVERLIAEFLNIDSEAFEGAWVPPGIAVLAPTAYAVQAEKPIARVSSSGRVLTLLHSERRVHD